MESPTSSAAARWTIARFATSAGDLRILSFDLGIDYDSLAGEGKAERAHALIVRLERRGRIADLLALGRQTRPDVPWEEGSACDG